MCLGRASRRRCRRASGLGARVAPARRGRPIRRRAPTISTSAGGWSGIVSPSFSWSSTRATFSAATRWTSSGRTWPRGSRTPRGPQESGFSLTISTLNFPPDFDFVLRAVLRGRKTLVDIARIRGRRMPLQLTVQAAPSTVDDQHAGPLRLHGAGSASASSSADRGLPPARLRAQGGDVLDRGHESPRATDELSPPGHAGHRSGSRGGWDRSGRSPRAGDDAETFDWMGREGAEALATFCQSRIDAFYERYAQLAGRADAVYFAEKFRVLTVPPAHVGDLRGGQGDRARAGLPRHDLLDACVQRQATRSTAFPPASIRARSTTSAPSGLAPGGLRRAGRDAPGARTSSVTRTSSCGPPRRSKPCSGISSSTRARKPGARC